MSQYLKNMYFLIRGYICTESEKKKLLKKIFQLFFFSFLIVFLINAFGYGIFFSIKKSITDYYGDVYIQLKKKISVKHAKQVGMKIRSFLEKDDSYFFYGMEHSLLVCKGDISLPIYVITPLEDNSHIFFDKKIFSNKDNFFCGSSLYEKYKDYNKKKILFIEENDRKNQCLHYIAMPVSFSGVYSFVSDDWNEKAIVFPAEMFESYFEQKTIQFFHIYLFEKKNIKRFVEKVKLLIPKNIAYISDGLSISTEYNSFFILFRASIYSIIFLIFLFSFILLKVLIELYVSENTFDYTSFRLIGIGEHVIRESVSYLFFFISLIAFLCALIASTCITFLVNYFKLLHHIYDFTSYFECIIYWKVIFMYYFIYFIFLVILIRYVYKKYFYRNIDA